MKRVLAIVLLMLSPLILFAGGAKEESEVTTIRYAFWGNPDAIGVEQEIIDAFEAANPDIKVEPVVTGYSEYHPKLFTLLAGGSAPDVMRIDSTVLEDFVDEDVLMPLDDLIERDKIDLDMYYKQGIVENSINGTMYGLPWGTAPFYMVLNLDAFEKYNVPLPPKNWTVDDFRDICEQFAQNKDAYGFSSYVNTLMSFYPFIWAFGGDVFDETKSRFTLDEPEAYQGIQYIADLYLDGLLPKDMITADYGTLDRWIINGDCAMSTAAAANMLTFQKAGVNFEPWPMPTGVTEKTTVVKSNVIGITQTSKQKEAAWRFVKFLRAPGEMGEELYMKAKRIPPTIKGDQYWAMYSDPTMHPKTIKDVTLEISDRYGRGIRYTSGMYEIEQVIMAEVQRVLLGEVSAEDAMKAIAPDVQAILDR